MDAGRVYYAKKNRLVVLKFVGHICRTMEGSYHLSTSLDTLLKKLFDNVDFDNMLVDLTETVSIDSTNLGLLAKATRLCAEQLGHKAMLLSTNDNINMILDSVGFDQVFFFVHERQLGDAHMAALEHVPETERALARTVLDAHRALSDLNDRNRHVFREVIEVLEGELKDKPSEPRIH